MSHSFALTMTRPHERFGMAQPLGRRLAQLPSLGWVAALWVVLVAFGFTYVSFMIQASAKGFQLRDVQRRVDRLQTDSRALETQVASLSSIGALSDRARAAGFVAVDRVESVNAGSNSYAFAR